MSLFIREQFNPRELRTCYKDAGHCADHAELVVWSPVSMRHTHWTLKPLCRTDERGRIIRGSRRRDPFIAADEGLTSH